MRPLEVLAKHAELRDRLGARTPLGVLSATFAASQWPSMSRHSDLGERLQNHLSVARTVVVTPRMSELALERAEHRTVSVMQVSEAWPPYPAGFAVFEQPIRIQEIASRWMMLHAMSWGPMRAETSVHTNARTGLLVVFWSDARRDRDDIWQAGGREYQFAREQTGGWAPSIMEFLDPEMRVGPSRITATDAARARNEKQGLTTLEEGTLGSARISTALWSLMAETIADGRDVQERPQGRVEWRQAERLRLDPAVTVMTLRREEQPVLNPGSGTPLQYRVPVEEHRRRYWVGSGAEKHLEWRTIALHERGPKNAPLRIRPKVSRLSR